MASTYYFKSTLFQIGMGEDEETNPGCYGKELGEWLCARLEERGYDVEGVIPDDWGWCVVCAREPYLLWVGCTAILPDDLVETHDPDVPPKGEDVVWCVFPVVEVPFFYLKSQVKRLLGRLGTNEPLQSLDREIQEILEAEPAIERCNDP